MLHFAFNWVSTYFVLGFAWSVVVECCEAGPESPAVPSPSSGGQQGHVGGAHSLLQGLQVKLI